MKLIFPFALLLCLAACGGAGPAAEGAPPAQHAQDVIISESQMGEGKWLLTATDADFYQADEGSYVAMRKPHIIFKTGGEAGSSITARKGRYDFDKNLIMLNDAVHGANAREGAELDTEILFYDTQTRLIWTDAPVALKRGGVVVKGSGLKANQDLSEIEIFKQKTALPQNIKDFRAATANL
ncbi:MAG: LPS export ABC transporter periplasmic protein LptC [Elusimicrobiota bacterium]|jgi:LPS export ABC transporter protein LptC|nr:LPS export ABC transporter periplasmic protein LptC [Elusimicrobiota bacterium]